MHVGSVVVLHRFAVDDCLQSQLLRVGDFIARCQPRTQRRESVGAFAFRPLRPALQLKGALGYVVGENITRDVLGGVGALDVFPAFADDDSEFNFPIGFLRAVWQDDVVVGTVDGAGRFHKYHRVFRQRHSRFGGVFAVV